MLSQGIKSLAKYLVGDHCPYQFTPIVCTSTKPIPTFLIVGATGNTRQAVTPAAQNLAKIPGAEVIQYNWTDITADWLREWHVVRAFITPHNGPNQFAEESAFHVAALNARVEYVVRISTTAPNVRPDSEAYYSRQHWAIETLLGSPEFSALG
ncbi:hypothetical protein BDW74DRAFT_174550 [Aspergillus multicolor]|uniref:uncharacterized protein n=1 Tax=Aspergillus multicolor TaxID=41759 RepID=UPI003CCCF24D